MIKIKDGQLVISPYAWLIAEYKYLWKRDTTSDKKKCMMELAYVYYMEDPRSPYMEFDDREIRKEKVIHDENIPDSWRPDKRVEAACAFYRSRLPWEASLLAALKHNCDVIADQLNNIDPTRTDRDGKLLNPPTQIAAIRKNLSDGIAEYKRMEQKLFTELDNEDIVRESSPCQYLRN